jgi:hypothetical protein
MDFGVKKKDDGFASTEQPRAKAMKMYGQAYLPVFIALN